MQEQQITLDEWDQPLEDPNESVTLSGMDDLIIRLRDARDFHDKKKKEASEAHAALEVVEKLVINTLTANKKTNYNVDGVASVSLSYRESFTTPKTPEQKALLFKYIQEKYGDKVLLGYQSINSQSLNAWAKAESASGVMVIPGLEAPTATEILSVRRK